MLQVGLQSLLNSYFAYELVFWGKLIGISKDYFIAMGIRFQNCYEFPEKVFFWASSLDFTFQQFPQLNDQHKDEYDKFTGLLTGEPYKILKKVEPER
jgi:radial spoke head protein 9